jgi:hypothetical protein
MSLTTSVTDWNRVAVGVPPAPGGRGAGRPDPVAYAEPRHVTDLALCWFYHQIDLPGVGTVEGQWDLRETIGEYLGPVDYRGKTVLDVGAAGGYLTFEMEKRGAAVVSFDMRDGRDWNMVPFAHPEFDRAKWAGDYQLGCEAVRNAYWFSHRALGSKARAYYGDVYAMPDGLGMFDVVMMGMCVPHFRDPFQAMYSASRRAADRVVVTQQASQAPGAYANFMPDPKTRTPVDAWWSLSEDCVVRILEILGFGLESLTRCEHTCTQRTLEEKVPHKEQCTTFVFRRKKFG